MTCEFCQSPTNRLIIFKTLLVCPRCKLEGDPPIGYAPFVIGDDIPGGVEIKHGVCWPDGTPRKFYSKSSIREAAFEEGYFQGDDTPRVNSRIQEERAHAREDRQKHR